MLVNIDRLQYDNQGKLVCFEFFDVSNEKPNLDFIKEKMKFIENEDFCDEFYLVQYKSLNLNEIFVGKSPNRKKYDLESFSNWFVEKNEEVNKSKQSLSKPLGSSTTNKGDPYIQDILTQVYSENPLYSEIDFSVDDSGINLVEEVLKGKNTYGFDFDLYETESRTVIEFLKRENDSVTNLTAHPVRYPWNKSKFTSLWKAAKRVNNDKKPNLYLVSYSDKDDEEIAVIQVLDFDCNSSSKKMVLSDIGYKLDNKDDLVNWLKLLNENYDQAVQFLEKKEKEVRDRSFFEELYESDNKSSLGKNYK